MRVAVIGGGPAGAAAALALAHAGRDVTLFDLPRRGEKPCGGALPEALLTRLHGFDGDALPHVTPSRARLETAGGMAVEVPLEGLRVYRRRDLDPALVAAASGAGAEVVASRVREVELGADGVRLVSDRGEERCDWAVAADGARGATRRALGLLPRGDSVGLGASLPHAVPPRLVLAFPDLADAYLWVFPRPGGCSVGIAYAAGSLSAGAARATLDDFVARQLGGARIDGAVRYRYPIPVYGPWTWDALARGATRRTLLVGDAAAVADPLTREGIRWGIVSGLEAAAALLADAPESYPGRLRAALADEMERARRAAGLFYEDRLAQAMVPVCRLHAGVRRVLGDLLACRQPYQGLRRRLVAVAAGA